MNIEKKVILLTAQAYSKLPEHRKAKHRKRIEELRQEIDIACKEARRPQKSKLALIIDRLKNLS